MNRIDKLFTEKGNNIFSVYFTAGYPQLNDTEKIIIELEKSGADLIEIGMPFSDPLADGPVIQQSSQIALQKGMSIKVLFKQLENIRQKVQIPLILMGYINPVLQFGIEAFCKKANELGIDGVILPDLPFYEFEEEYKEMFKKYNLHNIFLITPQTPDERIYQICKSASGFLYMVSSASTTGSKSSIAEDQESYFKRIQNMNLPLPKLIGFGISNNETFTKACTYANGAIIGSAFINALSDPKVELKNTIATFAKRILKS